MGWWCCYDVSPKQEWGPGGRKRIIPFTFWATAVLCTMRVRTGTLQLLLHILLVNAFQGLKEEKWIRIKPENRQAGHYCKNIQQWHTEPAVAQRNYSSILQHGEYACQRGPCKATQVSSQRWHSPYALNDKAVNTFLSGISLQGHTSTCTFSRKGCVCVRACTCVCNRVWECARD